MTSPVAMIDRQVCAYLMHQVYGRRPAGGIGKHRLGLPRASADQEWVIGRIANTGNLIDTSGMPPGLRPARSLVPLLAVLVAVPLVPAGSGDPAGAVPAAPSPAGEVLSRTVGLVTGDQVTYTEQPDGTVTVAVSAAERPDGERVAFQTIQNPDGYFVIPTDAWPGLAAGTLDEQLFNVTTLVAEGMAGEELPVIVGAAPGLRLAGERTANLPSIDATALRVDRDEAAALWETVADGDTPVWLDRTVTVALDESVPQIGAPAVWQAGYDGTGVTVAVLDTGYDPTHPDLAGRVAGTGNFTPDPIVDGHGHGTHVASIVAGSGAASGGAFRGVAPGAELLIGKVLPDSGEGPTSAVIEGMEWAARQGADIINLSLSGPPSDGTDPASLAVDALTAETGALFVVATGNQAFEPGIGTPATASAALSVGAVDKEDQLAPYSNRGPRLGDALIKPELTAPGTGIAAARAAGTGLGTPVDDHYTVLDGTSMATPHVAGSAALLAQAHPDWTWEQLKAALVSTAQPGEYTVFQGGAGRLDVARAVDQQVSGPGVLNLGTFPAPYDRPRTELLSYRNPTAAPVTLALAVTGRGWDGRELPAGGVTLSQSSVTVPAGGVTSVVLLVDPAPGEVGAYTGVVTASSGSVSLRSPFGYYKAVETHELTVHNLDYQGRPDAGQPIRAIRLDGALPNDPFQQVETLGFSGQDGTVRLQVAEGLYDVYGASVTWDVVADRITSTAVTEVPIGDATTVTLDARDAVRVDPVLPEPTDLKGASAAYARGVAGGGVFGAGFLVQYSPTELYLTPVAHTVEWLEIRGHWTVASPLVSAARLRNGDRTLSLTPRYHSYDAAPALAGAHDLPVVYAGTGTPGELEAARVAGAMALVRIPIPPGVTGRAGYAWEAAGRITAAAAELGAAGVMFYVDVPDALAIDGLRSESILQLSIPREQGIRARALVQLTGRVPARFTMQAAQHPERLYQLRYLHEDTTLPDPRPVVDVDELVAVPSRYHADQPDSTQMMFSYAFTPREEIGAGITPSYWAPFEVTEYVLPGEHLRWVRQVTQTGPPGNGSGVALSTRELFLPGEQRAPERWFQSPMGTGAVDNPLPTRWRDEPCTNCRHGDLFRPGVFYLDSDARHYERSFLQEGTTYRLFGNGEEIPNQGSPLSPLFPLAPQRASYRLELDGVQPGVPVVRTLAPRIRTAWTFTSTRPADGAKPEGYTCLIDAPGCAFQPLLQLDYELGLDLLNRAPAGTPYRFEVNVAPHSGTDRRLVRPIVRFDLSYSTDGGETWTAAETRRDQFGQLVEVTVAHPPLARTDGYVWLRTDARDLAGNRVEQTIERAYALR
jgi:subtilisin family serine protease